MAFAFFRRRQKMVTIIMVVLMVAFLIGFKGFESILERRVEREPVGQTRYGTIRVGDIRVAQNDLQLLGNLGLQPTDRYSLRPGTFEFQMIASQGNESSRVYAMLVQEARSADLQITREDINSFLASLDLGASQSEWSDSLRAMLRHYRMTEGEFHDAIERWLSVQRLYANNVLNMPPSEEAVKVLARDYLEKIKLRVLRIDAAKHLDKVVKPITADQIREAYDRFAELPAGIPTDDNPYALGYLVPDQVRISYMFMPYKAYLRAARPPLAEVKKHYDNNQQQYTAEKPAATETQPAPLPFAEVREEIAEELAQQKAAAMMDTLTGKIGDLLEKYPAGASESVHQWVKSQIIKDAAPLLATRLAVVNIQNMPLHEAIDTIRKSARIKGIAFPYGDSPNHLDPDILVTVQGTNITLGEALEQLRSFAKWPQIEWGIIDGIDGVLFATGGEGAGNFVPLVAQTSDLMNVEQLYDHGLLGSTMAGDQRTDLGTWAFSAEGLVNRVPDMPAMKPNQDGQVMVVRGANAGNLMWRLLEALPAHKPELDQVHQKIVEDLRLIEAFDIAKIEALKIEKVEDFEAAIAAPDADKFETDLISRRSLTDVRQMQQGGLDLPPSVKVREDFIEAAWRLAPSSPDEALQPSTFERFELPSRKQVLLMQRVDFQPLRKSDFDGMYRDMVRRELAQQSFLASLQWFSANMVHQRVNWQNEE